MPPSKPTPSSKPLASAKNAKTLKKNEPSNALPAILHDGVDRKPKLLYVNSYSLNDSKGVDSVGGLKVGTDDGIKYPSTCPAPLSQVDTAVKEVKTVQTVVMQEKEEEETVEESGHGRHGHHHHKKDKKEEEKEVEEEYIITLTETPTIFHLSISGSAVANDAGNYQKVGKRNESYALVKEAHLHADNLRERSAQTVNRAQKTKAVSATPLPSQEMGCQASDWDIYDANAANRGGEEEEGGTGTSTSTGTSTGTGTEPLEMLTKHWAAAITASDCMLSVSEAERKGKGGEADNAGNEKAKEKGCTSRDIIEERDNTKVMVSPSLLGSLQLMERAVMQNLNHSKHLKYRAFPEGAEAEITAALEVEEKGEEDGELGSEEGGGEEGGSEESEGEPTLESLMNAAPAMSLPPVPPTSTMNKLFKFSCPRTRGRTATTMSWNKGNPDVLAVGYGSFHLSASEKEGGYVMFWSIRNPSHPEKIIKTVSGVTAIDFSTAHPNMLAVGLYDGTVSIYDTRNAEFQVPVLDSSQLATKHMDPVWEVKWVDKGAERGESLVSIATDGRVLEWSMKKGLTMTPLMVLKRVGNSDGVISRQASGLCLDFPKEDTTMYFAGTEDGHIHRCSCSYNEQYLDTFSGHSGPVYRLKCSPFNGDAFLSCSADWTVKLWSAKESRMVFDFHSEGLSDVVNDITWSPYSSTVFASVTGDGRVDVWDLDHSEIEPKMSHRPTQAEAVLGVTPLTCCLFSHNAPVLATGDGDGNVEIFKLEGMPVQEGGEKEQTQRLARAMAPKEHA